MSFAVASRMGETRDNIWLDMSTSPKETRCWVRKRGLRVCVRTQASVPRLWRSGMFRNRVPALPGWADVWRTGPMGLGAERWDIEANAICDYYGFNKQSQLGHMRPPAPADFRVFDQRETEDDAPVASQLAKVLGEL
jgi:hypothetical protein